MKTRARFVVLFVMILATICSTADAKAITLILKPSSFFAGHVHTVAGSSLETTSITIYTLASRNEFDPNFKNLARYVPKRISLVIGKRSIIRVGSEGVDTVIENTDASLPALGRREIQMTLQNVSLSHWVAVKYDSTGFGTTDSRTSVHQDDITGTWDVVFDGTGYKAQTTLTLKNSDGKVTGTLATPDGSMGGVKGTFDGKTLVLSRETGMQTTQHYRVSVTKNRFSGTYVNRGKFPGNGSFTGTRRQ